MSNSLLNEKILASFKEAFPNVGLDYQEVPLGPAVAHAVFLHYKNAADVEKTWRKINNFIVINVQTSIKDEFGRWNTYLFFLVPDQLTIELKFKIENDTFSTRKIVVLPPNDVVKIIDDHILNKDIQQGITATEPAKQFEPNEQLWKLLEGKTLKVKKRTSAAEETFDQLLTIFKQKLDEI